MRSAAHVCQLLYAFRSVGARRGNLPPRPLLIGSNRDDISIFLGLTLAEIVPARSAKSSANAACLEKRRPPLTRDALDWQELIGLPMVDNCTLHEAVRRFFPFATDSNRSAILELYPLFRSAESVVRRSTGKDAAQQM